jgi:hypothetical protein
VKPLRRLLVLLAAAAGVSCTESVAPGDNIEGVPILLSLGVPAAVSQDEVDILATSFDLVDTYLVEIADSTTSTVLASDTVTVAPGQSEHALDVSLPSSTLGLAVRVTVVGLDGTQELYRTSTYLRVQPAGASTPVPLSVRYTGPGVRGTVTDATGAALADVDVDLMQGNSLIDAVTTEPDGTYLFVGVAVGQYQVQPTAPPTQFLCPSSRNVNMASASTAVVADFATNAASCQIELLILSGGDLSFADDTATVKALFAQTPNVNTSTFFFVNNAPGLNYLRQFDVILLFTNGLFNQSAVLGDQIEDYVQLGGNVITSTFYWQNRSDSGLGSVGWGALQSLDPFTSGAGQTYQAATLNANATVAHPLTAGLLTLTSTGFRGAVAAKAATTVVARWSDGSPLVGYQVLPWGSRMVGISLFPASGAAATGDVQTLWENAVLWAGAAGGPTPAPVTTAFDTTQPLGGPLGNAQTSQLPGVGTGARVYDDFTLTTPRIITQVQWQGIYCVTTVGAPAPPPTATSFHVAFYPDAGNTPNTSAALVGATYPVGSVTQTLLTTYPAGVCGAASPTSWPMYNYTVTLNTPFSAQPGVRYWFSVQANTPNLTTYWGWHSGRPSNNRSVQILATGATNVFTTDRAFSLLGA